MTPERWQQVKQIFQSAIERPPDERDAFLARACQDNHALRSEVESLISSHNQAGDSIEAMAVEAATEMLSADQTGSIVGKQIGHYQVLSQIGRGGMVKYSWLTIQAWVDRLRSNCCPPTLPGTKSGCVASGRRRAQLLP